MTNADSIDKSDIEDVSRWEIPVVEDPHNKPEDAPTNALNRKIGWKYEPPEEEEEIRPPTAEEIEAIRQAAYDEGFAQGKEAGFEEGKEEGNEEGFNQGLKEGTQKGYDEGLESGKEAAENQIQLWTALVEQLHSPLNKLDEEAKRQLTKLSVTLARAVIHTETKISEDVIITALEKGVGALPLSETQIQILVNEEDIETIKKHFSEEKIKEKGWESVSSPSITPGGCEVISHNNAVDVSVEKRCRSVLDNFLLNHGLSDE